MSKFKLRLFLIFALLLPGCYIKLANVDGDATQTNAECHSNGQKFSYYVYLSGGGDRKIAEQALSDSLSACSVKDVIQSENIEQDRINIMVYIHERKGDLFTRYFAFPGQLISLATLFIVPNYEGKNVPVETHIIVPKREHDAQFKIIGNEYKIENWLWLPFLFASEDSPEYNKNSYYYNNRDGSMKRSQLEYLGLRRIFDRIIIESVRD